MSPSAGDPSVGPSNVRPPRPAALAPRDAPADQSGVGHRHLASVSLRLALTIAILALLVWLLCSSPPAILHMRG